MEKTIDRRLCYLLSHYLEIQFHSGDGKSGNRVYFGDIRRLY